MTKIQLGSGPSSSATHHLTQSSRTLNRHYVERPSNLAIEEAAQSYTPEKYLDEPTRPSRLVNLRVHATDLAKAQENTTSPRDALPETSSTYVPKVIELGRSAEMPTNLPAEDNSFCASTPLNLQQMVPAEDTIEDNMSNNYNAEAYYNNDSSNNCLPATVNSPMETTYASSDTNNVYQNSTPQYPAEYNEYNNYDSVPSSDTTAVATPINTEELAMNIAADYAAASLGASVNSLSPGETITGLGVAPIENNSIDAIAQAASNAIASIRVATDPEEVAEQVASLKTFAENIKATSGAPEMLELSDTIEKFVDVAMKSSKIQAEVEKKSSPKSNATTSRNTKKSIPNIKISAKKPATRVSSTPAASNTRRPGTTKTAASHSPLRRVATKPVATRKLTPKHTTRTTNPRLITDEDRDLRNALRSVAAIDEEPAPKTKKKSTRKRGGSGKRFVLAFFCAAACVAAVVYFVGSNIPDISVKVAAMQSGIEASYPSYVPRGFSPSDISSENGKITLTFKGPEKASFTLTEEKSSWDSTTLLRNYVEPNWQTNYITTHEQGITIYISGANAAWVNGGVLYKIEAASSSLTKKQLRNIVTSL